VLHIDTKKLGRIERAGHRVTGSRLGRIQGARLAVTKMYPREFV
jgi:hypothetical protein